MQILLQGPLSYAPAPRVGKRAGLCPVLVTAKGCLQGLQFSGSPRWPQLVELWKCSRLFHLATEEANWLLQDQIYPIQGSEVSWVNFSRFHFEGICFTSQLMLRTRISHYNLLPRIFYRIYFLCFLLHTLPFTKKKFSASLPSFLRITPFPLWFKNVLRFLSGFEMYFCKKPFSLCSFP